MIKWINAALNKCLISAALHAVCFKYSCIVIPVLEFLNSSVVECLLSMQKGPRFNLGPGILFVCLLSHSAIAAFTICCI